MIDIKYVQEQYARMTDAELQHLAYHNSKDLNGEAVTALYQEFKKRKFDTSQIATIKIDKINDHLEDRRQEHKVNVSEFKQHVWSHCFEARTAGKTDLEIFEKLVELGLSPELSDQFVSAIDSKASKAIEALKTEKLIGGSIAVFGLIATLFIVVNNLPAKPLIFSVVATIIGAIRYSTSSGNIKQMQDVLEGTAVEIGAGD
ncbi:MAG: hypothetical protein V4717_14890 [Bacteroidota bacterium]